MSGKRDERYAAIVVYPDDRMRNMRSVVGKEAKKKLKTREYINIREIIYSSLLDIWIGVCELPKKKDEESEVYG